MTIESFCKVAWNLSYNQVRSSITKKDYIQFDIPNAETVAKLLGISISSSYELMHEKGFPSLRIGSRLIVPKEKFRAWVEEKTGGSI